MRYGKSRIAEHEHWLNWHLWFAWYPVDVDDGLRVWLEPVERKAEWVSDPYYHGPYCGGYYVWSHRLPAKAIDSKGK